MRAPFSFGRAVRVTDETKRRTRAIVGIPRPGTLMASEERRMTRMFRALALFLALLPLCGPVLAFSPEGATATVADFGGRHGFAIGVSGFDTTLAEKPTDDRLTMTRLAAIGVTWSRSGFYVGVSAGHMDYAQYVLPSYTVGSAKLASISIGHAIADVSGGTLAVGLSAHRYYFNQASIGLVTGSLRWSRPF
jgi:hypothetical protein